jgi:hypothetical protein
VTIETAADLIYALTHKSARTTAKIDPRFDQRLSDTLTSTWAGSALFVPHGLEGHHPRVKDSA